MSIDSWLTTIGLLVAIVAFFPKAELRLLGLKLHKAELWAGLFVLMILLPFLIYFYAIADRLPFLFYFTIRRGLLPKNVAFLFLYGLISWLVIRFVWFRPNKKFSAEILAFYQQLLKEVPFDVFFNIFSRYEETKGIRWVWPKYRALFIEPLFLKGIIKYQPYFLYRNWRALDRQADYEQVLDLFIYDSESAYYKDIEAHWNSNTLIIYSSSLLNELIGLNLRQSIKFGIIKYISKKGVSILHQEGFNSNSIYLQTPIFIDHSLEGLQLPLFYHVQFISLLYATAIADGIDIEEYGGKNMLTIYSTWIKQVMDTLTHSGKKFTEKDNSNYHWLIGKMLDNSGYWLRFFYESELFNKPGCSYVEFIPACLGFCFAELYKGYRDELFPAEFLVKRLHYDVLSVYYNTGNKPSLQAAIEKYVIVKIPEAITINVFNFSLEEEFGMNFDDFYNGQFHVLQDQDILKTVKHLRTLLKSNNQLR